MPLFYGGMKETLWDLVVEHFLKKLARWKGAMLSQAGKLQIINSILQSLSVYFMCIFKIPRKVLERITQIQKDFLWIEFKEKKRMALIS